MTKMSRVWAVLLLAGLVLLGCEVPPSAKAPDEVTLQLKWVHQAQFAGFYVAQEKGYYARENLRVTFLEGGKDVDLGQRVQSGQADFGVLTPEFILKKRSQGGALTAIAAIYRRSAVVFVAKADSGIVRPTDFMGKTVAAGNPWGSQTDFEMQFRAMMRRLDLDISKVNVVPYDPAYTAFYSGEVQVSPAYSTGGLIKMRQKGLQLNLIWPDDYGIHFYSDTLATSDRLIAENPDLVTRFLRASLRGWRDAVEDYLQAVAVTLQYARVPDPELQTAMMEAMLPLVHTGEDRIGWMTPEMWQGMVDVLLEEGLLKAPCDAKQAYTLRFLSEIHGVNAR
jgi:NitT/TauT family transport system substrate-binding protein